MSDSITRARPDAAPAPGGERVVVAGPGRVGLSLASWLVQRGARLLALAGRRRPADEDLPRLLAGASWRPLDDLRSDDADLLILAVSDPALEAVAAGLAARPQAPVVLHVSGHFDAEALAPLRGAAEMVGSQAGSEVGSWHPLRAFTAPSADAGDAEGITFAIDGDPRAEATASRLTSLLGGRVARVSGSARCLYHLAASLAAGGVVTLLAAVDQLRRRAGLPDDLMRSYLHLTRGALEQLPIRADGPGGVIADGTLAEGAIAAAITGPAARGDLAMLERQHSAVAALAPDLLPLIETLEDTTRKVRLEAREATKNTGAEQRSRAPNHR